MKKVRLFMVPALTALALPALAQTNVTLYGLGDMGVLSANHVRSGGVGSPEGSVVRLESGNTNASRLGFRGREDLGSGLYSVFVLEMGFSMDTGAFTGGGRAFGRASYVGLGRSDFGEVQLGRQINSMYEFAVMFDPVAPARFASPVFDAAYAGRADNAIKYIGRFGKANIKAQYSFGFDSIIANGGELPQFKVGKEMGIHADYTFEKVTVGFMADRQNGTSVATANDKVTRLDAGIALNLNPVKLFAVYQNRKDKVGVQTTTSKLYWLAASYRPTPLVGIAAGVYVNNPGGNARKTVMPSVLTTYDLSKRTNLYAQVGYVKNEANASAAMVGAVNPGRSQTGFQAGVVHRF